jgi:two-component system LytT family sensor kinase
MKIGTLRLNTNGLNTIIWFILCFCVFDYIHTYVGGLGEGLHLSWKYLVVSVAEFWASYFAALPLAIFLAGRYRLDLRRRRTLLPHIAGALVFTYVHIFIVTCLPFFPLRPELSFAARFFRNMRLDFGVDFLTYWAILGATYTARHYSELQQRQVAEAQLEASLVQARLQALQAQLRPHFFFNTLQAISVLALKSDKNGVVETLGHLSNLLRVTFDTKRAQKITLASELEFLDEYLAIQRLSLGDRLSVHREIGDEVLSALVPSMLLQPVVENAIVHGIARQQGPGTIVVAASRGDGMLHLRVSDSGPGFRQTQHRDGVGLANSRARLQQLYHAAFRLDVGDSVGGGASVTISIPYETSGRGTHSQEQEAVPA